jgi:hypothetical protein
MSYIIERGSPLILTKLTNKGRLNIATGTFNVKYFGLSDSEVSYYDVSDQRLLIMKTKDNNPLPKSYIQKDMECRSLIELKATDINYVRAKVKNKARKRGFFTSNIVNTANLDSSLFKFSGQISLDKFDGSKSLDLTGAVTEDDFLLLEDGDIFLFKFDLSVTGSTDTYSPVPYLFFGIERDGASPIVQADRFLPYYSYLSGATETYVDYYVLPKKSEAINYYSPSGQSISWNSEVLEFYEDCDLNDVPVWNFNIPYCSDFMGTSGCTDSYKEYESQEYVGTLHYLDYCEDCIDQETENNKCEDALSSIDYLSRDSIGIIHFSNFNTRNEYGEFLYIDNSDFETSFKLHLPTLMWHKRSFSGSTTGDNLGMTFVSTGDVKYMDFDRENIEYYDLVEDQRYIASGDTLTTVGKVFPNLKIVVIDHPDLLAAMTYKSNRNWTLPKLNGQMIYPIGGLGQGILPREKRLYLTYMLKADNGIQNTFPQQNLIYFDNTTQADRDVDFTLENINYLPYMRQYESETYDQQGFYAHHFIVLYQVTDIGEKPKADEWNMVDFTNNTLTTLPSYTINPYMLENQDASANNFQLTTYRANNFGLGKYSNQYHCLGCDMTVIDLGAEALFFGNVETYIGAEVYKWIVNLKIDSSYIKTQNKTYSDGEFYLSDISFYNENKEQVVISKLSRPIKLREGTVTEVEISLDF